jgi:2-succinyl-6-hydroxy-2,4-cyclohexadiene-1-carboxylate synthase
VVYRRTFEDCSHAPHLETPEEYAREVISFLQTPWYESPQFENSVPDKSAAGGHG